MANKTTRTRNWTFIIYPESAPANWREILDEKHVEWVESPIHDSDINATGELKKSHIHILVLFGGVKAYEQVCEFMSEFNSTVPQPCHNTKALVRYMAHLDNPEKHQYKQSDIVAHGGVEIADLLRPSASEKYSMLNEIFQHISDNKIVEYKDLMDYARAERFDDWYPIICDNCTYVITQYIKSARHRRHLVDNSTGEILD
jgi:hypothetical protein